MSTTWIRIRYQMKWILAQGKFIDKLFVKSRQSNNAVFARPNTIFFNLSVT